MRKKHEEFHHREVDAPHGNQEGSKEQLTKIYSTATFPSNPDFNFFFLMKPSLQFYFFIHSTFCQSQIEFYEFLCLSSLTLSFADFMNHFKNKHQTERNLADPLERCVILSTAPPSEMTIKHEKSNNRNALTSRSINFAVQWLDDVFAGFSACGSQTGAAVLFMTIFRRGRRMARGKLLNI